MFSSYGGISSRSKSTTDIFRASSAELDDASYPPADQSYARYRKNTDPAALANGPRRRVVAAPVPPRRSSSSLTVNLEPEAADLRSQPSEEEGESSHDSVLPTQLSQSPGSKNFVKRLVATLERRQREQQLAAIGPRSDADATNNELLYRKSARKTVPSGSRKQELLDREQACVATCRLPATTQLEDLQERDEDADEEWRDSADLAPQFWEQELTSSLGLPIHVIERKSDGNNDNNDRKSRTVKRTIKSVFSSIINWKNSKSLPKGSREYYAARESLGEEMRAFRRDTMPRLIERATGKGKLDRNWRGTAAPTRRDDDQREFSQLIGCSPGNESSPIAADAEPPSTATIHPVYGSCSAGHQRRSWHKQDLPSDHHSDAETSKPELLYGSIKVQPPTPPPRASQQLLRPSKVRDLQKRISRESFSQVQLRRPSPASSSSSSSSSSDKRNSIVYDVPQSNRRVESAEDCTVLVERERVPGYISRSTPPEYENVSGIIGAHNDDKRLHCTAFTTF
ncbi:uncharacterized protein LOC100678599 [Nasonia vitripennis]|uniref:Uncharacterized protein n=1 Tax=Nasonia vitripennis TaxID=7425 RepID=A0A7M7LNN7_NASVI|nr:uncharacterized protein LOC100678599 [Nasonia vitripennis]